MAAHTLVGRGRAHCRAGAPIEPPEEVDAGLNDAYEDPNKQNDKLKKRVGDMKDQMSRMKKRMRDMKNNYEHRFAALEDHTQALQRAAQHFDASVSSSYVPLYRHPASSTTNSATCSRLSTVPSCVSTEIAVHRPDMDTLEPVKREPSTVAHDRASAERSLDCISVGAPTSPLRH
ncbi:uncharacterized protein MYCGRDRAFT_94634 [Zymoseptoria tritici IPO323]|uniref:Uncharacterized protein n=1 Tax=Zymoseptoria tritici (strain CBS 115943 / IPO323) TaxID=336722 RepID=F9XGK9_ZYMTI|nr:uncharacterized protein MYCGRDRAFT_94634 [Zymoseptoria tritici IPO323]EGP86018.1 hypothetical protein MYCGRDRAFT_94634 [Zymoseptoria tritici IPO323]